MLDKTNAEAGEVMQCLIEHKSHAEMNRKCTVGIEHHQLVSLLLAFWHLNPELSVVCRCGHGLWTVLFGTKLIIHCTPMIDRYRISDNT